jgi:hypothetical protein
VIGRCLDWFDFVSYDQAAAWVLVGLVHVIVLTGLTGLQLSAMAATVEVLVDRLFDGWQCVRVRALCSKAPKKKKKKNQHRKDITRYNCCVVE